MEIPVQEGQPFRYHVTLSDVKRNYVRRQEDIIYETIISGFEWARFVPSEPISAEMVVGSSTLWGRIGLRLRELDESHEDGWTAEELAADLEQDRTHVIKELSLLENWHPGLHTDVEERVMKMGRGVRGDPYRYRIETRLKKESVRLSTAPGNPETA
jgi:hypothetical protein